MKLKPFSFRFKITFISILIIGLTTFISFQVYSKYLAEQLYRDAEENTIHRIKILQEQVHYKLSQKDGHSLYSILNEFQSMGNVITVSYVDTNNIVIYEQMRTGDNSDTVFSLENLPVENSLNVKRVSGDKKNFLRAFIGIENSPFCHRCHTSSAKTFGTIVVDYSLEYIEEHLGVFQKFGIIFTLLLLGVILILVVLLHYIFVRKSLSSFNKSIRRIRDGNLDERVGVPETEELGNIAKSFNEMLDRLQNAQEEIKIFHQKELYNTQKLTTIGEMAANLAHEIKNPLMGISNAITVIAQEKSSDEEKRSVLEEIQRQVDRVNKAINDLFQFSYPGEFHPCEGSINEVIVSLVSYLKTKTGDKKIDFIMNLQSDLPQFKFDIEQFEIALINLGQNAIQAIEKEGRVMFTTRFDSDKGSILISIEDSGIGIPRENISQIFKPFFTTRLQGTGLGLAITKEIIERHDGVIFIESSSDGGNIFTISLPIKVEDCTLV